MAVRRTVGIAPGLAALAPVLAALPAAAQTPVAMLPRWPGRGHGPGRRFRQLRGWGRGILGAAGGQRRISPSTCTGFRVMHVWGLSGVKSIGLGTEDAIGSEIQRNQVES